MIGRVEPRAGWGAERREFHAFGVDAVTASAEGEVTVTADAGAILIWGPSFDRPVGALRATGGYRGASLRLVRSAREPKSWLVVVAHADRLEIRDLQRDHLVIVPPLKGAKAGACSADGRTFAFASSTANIDVLRFDGINKVAKERVRVAGIKGVTAVALSSSGERIAIAGNKLVIARTSDGSPIATLDAAAGVRRLAFVDEHTVLAVGDKQGWRFTVDGKAEPLDVRGYVSSIDVASEGVVLAGSDGVVLLDARLSPRWLTRASASAAAWRGPEVVAALSGDNGVRRYAVASATAARDDAPAESVTRDARVVRDAAIAPTDRWLAVVVAAQDDGASEASRELTIFDLASGQLTCSVERVRTVGHSKLAVAGPLTLDWYDERVTIAPDLTSIGAPSPRAAPEELAIQESSDGARVGGIVLGRRGGAISADGREVAAWGDELVVSRVGEKKPYFRRAFDGGTVLLPPAFGTIVVLRAAATSRCIDLATGLDRPWYDTLQHVGAAAISADGRLVAVDEQDPLHIVLRRASDGARLAFLRGLWVSPRRLLFSHASTSVIAVCPDGALVRWDLGASLVQKASTRD